MMHDFGQSETVQHSRREARTRDKHNGWAPDQNIAFTGDSDMTPQDFRDQMEICHLLSRYNILGDRGRVAEMVDVFAPEASLEAIDKSATGHAGIAALLNSNPPSPRHTVTRHHLGTQLIEVDGDSASAWTYFMVHTNIGPDHHGVYVDRLTRIDGRWLITHRDVRLDWQSPESVYEPMPVYRRQPNPAR